MIVRVTHGTAFALLFAIVALGAVPVARGEDAPAATQDKQEQAFDTFAQRLKRTPDQQSQIKPLVEARNRQLKAIYAKFSGDSSHAAKRSALREARAAQSDFNSKLKPLLSGEQQAELDHMRAEARAKIKEKYDASKAGSQ